MVVNELNMRLESDEEAEQSCAEKLFLFLHSAKAHQRSTELIKVFNPEFPFDKIIDSCRGFLEVPEQEFVNIFSPNAVIVDGEQYVHISEFSADAVVKRKVNRCLEKLPSFVSRTVEKCPMHSKRCRLVRFMYGFLCYLHLLTEEGDTAELPSTIAPLEDEGGDEEIIINPAEERAIVISSVLPAPSEATTSSSITPTETHENTEQGDLPLPCFPSFPMLKDLNYVLLIDIMHVFGLREDYCLSAISSFCEADMDWVEDGTDQHLLVDSAVKDNEYKSGKDIIKAVFDEWNNTCEGQLPSEREHAAATESLGLTNMGKFYQPAIQEDSSSAVSLWTRSSLEDDENQKVLAFSLINMNTVLVF